MGRIFGQWLAMIHPGAKKGLKVKVGEYIYKERWWC
jgi:hypothetical protein